MLDTALAELVRPSCVQGLVLNRQEGGRCTQEATPARETDTPTQHLPAVRGLPVNNITTRLSLLPANSNLIEQRYVTEPRASVGVA